MKPSTRLITIGLVLSSLFLVGCAKAPDQPKESVASKTEPIESIFNFAEESFDFGLIKQSGGIVSHDFAFTYNGDQPITITGTPGSCLCATGKVSKTEFTKGDTGILTVEFDPNLHEEPEGRFYKTVSLITDPKLEEIPEVKIWVEIDLDLGPEAFKLKGPHKEGDEHHDDEEAHKAGRAFHIVKPIELKAMLADKDFFLLDVHIPEQNHISGTDAFVDYRKLAENMDKLPKDKNTKLVVYCRSGGMSRSAVNELIDLGFTNVYDLEGGINAYNLL